MSTVAATATTAATSNVNDRIDALLSRGLFSNRAAPEEAGGQKRQRDNDQVELAVKYGNLKEQLATLDRTLRTELEKHEETQIELVRVTQQRDVLKTENNTLKAKVEELYLTITKISEAAARDREEAVAAALAKRGNQN